MKLKDTELRFDFSFFAVLAFLIFADESGTALLSLIACILHECGHIIAMLLFKIFPDRITFYGGGISIKKNLELTGLAKRIFILSAGCIVNLIIFFAGVILHDIGGNIAVFSAVNLLICIFNILPIGYFDGAEILTVISERLFSFKSAAVLRKTVGIVMSVLLLCGVFAYCVLSHQPVNISLGFTVLYLILAQIIG